MVELSFHSGYHNTLCNEDIDECQDPGVCNGGTCFNNEGGFSCSCQAGFFGRHCEVGIVAICHFPSIHAK